jgi:radical SAM-linked protein
MKYIIKFKKEGRIRFISHLDLQKVFLRLFRIIGVKPKYSNGFNPHPQLSFALPLSLGFASEAEYLELETEDSKGFDVKTVYELLEEKLPKGLSIVYIKENKDIINKKLASYINCAEYSIVCPSFDNADQRLNDYLYQEQIPYEKHSRKTGKTKEIDLKSSIINVKLNKHDNNNIMLIAILNAGNNSVLNPNVLMESLFAYLYQEFDKDTLIITRKRVYCKVDGKIIGVDELMHID